MERTEALKIVDQKWDQFQCGLITITEFYNLMRLHSIECAVLESLGRKQLDTWVGEDDVLRELPIKDNEYAELVNAGCQEV